MSSAISRSCSSSPRRSGPRPLKCRFWQKFARIGIEAGKQFPTVKLTDADKAAVAESAKAAATAIKAKIETMGKLVNGWKLRELGHRRPCAL